MNYDYLKRDLKKYVCNMGQIAGIRRTVLDDGFSRGIRTAEVNNGSGLDFNILIDRGMDIGAASCRGIPFAWLAPNAAAHPAFYDPAGIGWLRSWGGGLLTGCGLVNAGRPSACSSGDQAGLHGRVSNIPAENCVSRSAWVDRDYVMTLSGEMREARLFGENILLIREISTVMGRNVICVKDTIRNEGCRPSPLMLLYHINIGFPMIDENASVRAVEHHVAPRDPEAEKGLHCWNRCALPDASFAEQCYYHDIPADSGGMARIAISNTELGMELELAYRKTELPFFTQWKMMGQGEYVMGLEPANCHPEGQIAEREKFNSLRILQPGEEFRTHLEISINFID